MQRQSLDSFCKHESLIKAHFNDGSEKLAQQSKISVVASYDDFFKVLAEDERLTIIKFHATWCKSCQKFGLKFRKLAYEYGDRIGENGKVLERGQVRFAEVEFAANADLCRSLGVKRLPYIHMYRGSEGLLNEFACGPKHFHLVCEALIDYLKDNSKIRQIENIDGAMLAGEELGREIVDGLVNKATASEKFEK